jgi:hypothetical protein
MFGCSNNTDVLKNNSFENISLQNDVSKNNSFENISLQNDVLKNNTIILNNTFIKTLKINVTRIDSTDYINTELTALDINMLYNLFKTYDIIIFEQLDKNERLIMEEICDRFNAYACITEKNAMILAKKPIIIKHYNAKTLEYKMLNDTQTIDLQTVKLQIMPK